MTPLGERLRVARQAKGLSLRKLGGLVDRAFETIGSVERGERVPSPELLRRLCEALDLDLAEMMPLSGRLPPEMVVYLCETPAAREVVKRMMAARGFCQALDDDGRVLESAPFGQRFRAPFGATRFRFVLEERSGLAAMFTTPPYSKEGA